MSFWFSWWFSQQPLVTQTDNTSVRVYLNELKEKLKKDCRAERAECRTDLTEQHAKAMEDHRKRLLEHLAKIAQERASHQADVDDAEFRRLQRREKRLANDFNISKKIK